MKKTLLLLLLFPLISMAQFKELLNKAQEKTTAITGSTDIASGLKEALTKGVTEEVSLLTAVDGFYKNDKVKILFPEELRKMETALRKIGAGSLADEGIKTLNRAAEDAVKEATPIFLDAIKKMTITDAKNILMGKQDAATRYLDNSTRTTLYAKFQPIVQQSIGKVGADKVWSSLVSKYNTLPLSADVNPDLNDYVTQKALDGVFVMIALEELKIRTDVSARTSSLLQKVFAQQDKK